MLERLGSRPQTPHDAGAPALAALAARLEDQAARLTLIERAIEAAFRARHPEGKQWR